LFLTYDPLFRIFNSFPNEFLSRIIRSRLAKLKMKPKGFVIIILIVLLSLGISTCTTERKVIINSLPNDNSWFTKAKSIALMYGKKDEVLGYLWYSKTIFINSEKVYYSIQYVPSKYIKVPMPNMVSLTKKTGSLMRSVTYFENTNQFLVSDSDFYRTVSQEFITQKEAEDLAYNFFKELDRYGLLW
jgi:hypothetical protein